MLLAMTGLLLAMPFTATAADQAQTQTMAQDQIHSVSGSAAANSMQYQESHMWAEQTANMGDTTQVKAGEAKKEMEKRSEGIGSDGSGSSDPSGARTGADGSDKSKSGSKK